MALFWKFDTKDFDFQRNKSLVTTCVISLGRLNDWYVAFDVYGGVKAFRKIAKEEVIGLTDKNLVFMCWSLHIKKGNTQCFKRK